MAPPTGLSELLWRNAGNRLTPELIVGILHGTSAVERLATGEPPQPLDGPWVTAPHLRPSTQRLVVDDHARVAAWVAQQADCSVHAWAGYVCIGLEVDGMLVAGVVLESFSGRGANIHVAGIGKYWLSRNLLYSIFHYCFNVLKLKRLTGLVAASNAAALRFDQHIGFQVEATLADGAKDGDLIVLRMRREDCRYLPPEEN